TVGASRRVARIHKGQLRGRDAIDGFGGGDDLVLRLSGLWIRYWGLSRRVLAANNADLVLVLDRQEVARHPAEDVVHDRLGDRGLLVFCEAGRVEAHMAELVDHELERDAELERV